MSSYNPSIQLRSVLWTNYAIESYVRLYKIEQSSTLKKYELWIYVPVSYQSLLIYVNDHIGGVTWTTTTGTPPDLEYVACEQAGKVSYASISEKSSNWSITGTQPAGPVFWFNNGTRV